MRYFGPATPTSTTVEVSRLGGLDFMIEMEVDRLGNRAPVCGRSEEFRNGASERRGGPEP